MMQVVVLASGSRYRAELLCRLGIKFKKMSPDIDESPYPSENAQQLCQRLACQKAYAVRDRLQENNPEKPHNPTPEHLIIASDQMAFGANQLLGKPGTADAACAQLESISGQQVLFYTALHIISSHSDQEYVALDVTKVQLRELDRQTIKRYVELESPLDCAGSFKAESLGIALFDTISSEDPTGLIGLPLIKVCEGLRQLGMQLP